MKKTHLLFLTIALIILGPVQAGTLDDFCSEVTKTRSLETKNKNNNKFLWKYILNPKSLVELHKVPTTNEEFSLNTRVKLAFLSLPSIEFTMSHKKELQRLESQRRILTSDLKGVLKLTTSSACMEFIERKNLGELVLELESLAPRFLELIQIQTDAKSFKAQKKKKNFLKRSGWKVFENKNLNEMYKLILDKKPNDVLIVGHASSEGKVYDAFKNPLPKSFFKVLNIENLILYSCYSEQVKSYYAFNNFNIFLSAPTNFAAEFLNESVPLNSLKAIKAINLRSSKKDINKVCTLNFPILKTSKTLGVTLNKTFIGPLGPTLNFPCSLLGASTSIEIFSTLIERHIGSIGVATFYLENEPIHLKEFKNLNNNRHIVSRATFIKRDLHEIY